MSLLRCACALAALLFCASAVADDQYLCVPDQSNGFSFDKQDGWRTTNFKVAGKKYLFRRVKADDAYKLLGAKWMVFELGEQSPLAWCEKDFDDRGHIACASLGHLYEWRMNRNTMRFLLAYVAGYTD